MVIYLVMAKQHYTPPLVPLMQSSSKENALTGHAFEHMMVKKTASTGRQNQLLVVGNWDGSSLTW